MGSALPKLGMEPVRRGQLIDAAIETLRRHGWQDTTVVRIAREAGLSPGIIHHYFAGKDDLLAAAMRRILVEFRTEVTRRLGRADSPRDRLQAIIDGCFDPSQFRPEICAAWLAFWAQAPFAPALDRLRRIYLARMRSGLLADLRRLLPPERTEAAALSLGGLIDGLFLRAASGDASVTPQIARALATDTLDRYLADAPRQRELC
ncbi:choline-binding transcriptional repressor BetI [Geminicoccus roseus]|uniref:choline-binding transcriptional repressor BetI n=1 Tax=Geminicoccus roseus TaxID=404900 RepID=UPI0003FBE4F5|nr:transcriptional regulator BetI [Geminicoccus roseus]